MQSWLPRNCKKLQTWSIFDSGLDTWKEILEERARRIQEQKEHERQLRIQKAKEQKELMDALKMIGIVTLSIVVILGIWLVRFTIQDWDNDTRIFINIIFGW